MAQYLQHKRGTIRTVEDVTDLATVAAEATASGEIPVAVSKEIRGHMELMYTGILAQTRAGGQTNIIAQLVQISEERSPPPLEGFTDPLLANPSTVVDVPLLPSADQSRVGVSQVSGAERQPPPPGHTEADSLAPFVPQTPWELAGLDKPPIGKKYIWFLSNPSIRVLLPEGAPLPKGFSFAPPQEVCKQPTIIQNDEVNDE